MYKGNGPLLFLKMLWVEMNKKCIYLDAVWKKNASTSWIPRGMEYETGDILVPMQLRVRVNGGGDIAEDQMLE